MEGKITLCVRHSNVGGMICPSRLDVSGLSNVRKILALCAVYDVNARFIGHVIAAGGVMKEELPTF
jgi:ABC-type cobalamin transport system permease subunit